MAIDKKYLNKKNQEAIENSSWDMDTMEDAHEDNWRESIQFVKPQNSASSWSSLILGIIASLGWIMPIIGFPVTVVGIVLGAMNLRNRQSKGIAIAGFVVNIVFLCASIAKGIVDIVCYAKKSRH